MAYGTLEVLLVSAKGLENSDVLKSMDPFVVLTCRTQQHKSGVASGGGTTPEWNETFVFTVSDGVSDLKLRIMDKDTGNEDDSVGEATVPLEPVLMEGSVPVTTYRVVKDEKYKGEIQIGMTFRREERAHRGIEREDFGGWKQSAGDRY